MFVALCIRKFDIQTSRCVKPLVTTQRSVKWSYELYGFNFTLLTKWHQPADNHTQLASTNYNNSLKWNRKQKWKMFYFMKVHHTGKGKHKTNLNSRFFILRQGNPSWPGPHRSLSAFACWGVGLRAWVLNLFSSLTFIYMHVDLYVAACMWVLCLWRQQEALALLELEPQYGLWGLNPGVFSKSSQCS